MLDFFARLIERIWRFSTWLTLALGMACTGVLAEASSLAPPTHQTSAPQPAKPPAVFNITAPLDGTPLGRRFWIAQDEKGTATLQDMQRRPEAFQQNSREGLNLGFRNDVTWLRVYVTNNSTAPVDWFLDLGDGLIESVTLYEPGADGQYTSRTTGTAYPWRTRDVPLYRIVFSLQEPAQSERVIYLRIASEYGKRLLPRAYAPTELPRATQVEFGWVSLLLGVLAGVGAYHLILFGLLRDRAYLWHACLMFTVIGSRLLFMSAGLESLWPEGNRYYGELNLLFTAAALASGLLFARAVLPLQDMSVWWKRSMDLMLWAWLALMLSPLVLSLWQSAQGLVWLSLPTQLLVLAAAVAAWRSGSAVARWFLPAWLLLILGAMVWSLRSAGLLPFNEWTSAPTLVGAAGNALLMAAALAYRVRDETLARFEAQRRLVQSRGEANAILEQRVEERTRELQAAKEQAESANRLKDLFVRLVSHDLRSPLTSIMAGAQRLPPAPAAQGIHATAQSLVKTIDRLLDLDYLSSGRLAVRRTWVDGRDLAERQIAQLKSLAQERGIALHNEVPARARLFVDQTLLGEVLGNLIGNALKFCRPGDEVRLQLHEDGCSLVVRDTGPGFDAAAPEAKGHGLGLRYAREILAAHGGALVVSSGADGSCLTLQLPPVGPVVLLVDDQPVQRDFVLRILEREVPRCQVAQAADGLEAMRMLEQVKPDLAITDIQMPGMDGLSWVRALRQDRRWQSLPVLVISTPSDQQPAEDLLRQSLDAGADAFLPKPLDATGLARQVQSLLEADTDA